MFSATGIRSWVGKGGKILATGRWGINLADGKPACRVDAGMLADEIREMLPETLPQVICKSRRGGVSWSLCVNGSMMLGLLNYGDTPASVRILHGKKKRKLELEVEAFEFL